MLRDLRRWRRLPKEEKRALRQALVALPLVGAALRLAGLRRCHRRLAARPVPAATATAKPEEARAQAQALSIAIDRTGRRLPGGASCLDRSFCLWWLLRRRGIATELRIGVRRSEARTPTNGGAQEMEAHAWVELDGQVLNDSPNVHDRYAAFDGNVLPELPRTST